MGERMSSVSRVAGHVRFDHRLELRVSISDGFLCRTVTGQLTYTDFVRNQAPPCRAVIALSQRSANDRPASAPTELPLLRPVVGGNALASRVARSPSADINGTAGHQRGRNNVGDLGELGVAEPQVASASVPIRRPRPPSAVGDRGRRCG